MEFTVERQRAGSWQVVATAVEAESALQAVTRSSPEPGTHRATERSAYALGEYFRVPELGPPEPIAPPGAPPA